MKKYDAIFAAAVVAALVGVLIVMLREPLRYEPIAPRLAEAPPKAPPHLPIDLDEQSDEAPDQTIDETPPPQEAEPVEEAVPEPEPVERAALTPQQMILGEWTMTERGHTIVMTFYEDGGLDFYSPDMPQDLPIDMDASYTWDSDDHFTIHMSMTGPDGQTRDESVGMTIVSLTENQMTLRDDRRDEEQTFTR
jgi:hypothetical protein